MSISMHSASVPVFVRMLGNLRPGSTRPRRMRRRRSSIPSVYLTAAPRARHAAVHAADPDRLRRRQVLRRAAGRRRGAEVRGQRNQPRRAARAHRARRSTTCKSVPADADRRQRRQGDRVPRRDGTDDDSRARPYLKHFVLPNFFFHVTTDVRAAAPQRRRPRQGRLPRRRRDTPSTLQSARETGGGVRRCRAHAADPSSSVRRASALHSR